MKCGSCRDANAESYKKVTEDDSIFEILKKLNPRRTYNAKNSYFCGVCIQLALAKQAQMISTMSDQNATNVTNLNSSTSSKSSRDEFDIMVQPKYVFSDTGTPIQMQPNRRDKRPAEGAQRAKPCPKRFKKPFTPNLQENLPAVVNKGKSQQNTPESSQRSARESSQRSKGESSQRSSESIPENDMLLNVDPDTSSSLSSPLLGTQSPSKIRSSHRSPVLKSKKGEISGTSPVQHDSVSLSSEVTRNSPKVTSNVATASTSRNKPQSVIKARPKTILQYDSDSMSDDESISSNQRTAAQTSNQIRQIHKETTVPGPSAPVAKNPRIRQDNSKIPTNINAYFSTQNFNVSNYSRSLAG